VFRRRYAPLGFVAWLVAKRKLHAAAGRLALGLVAASAAVAAALVAWRLTRPRTARERGNRADGTKTPTIRLTFEDGEWVSRLDGSPSAASRHRTKADAEKAARALAQEQGAELIVYTREGEIQRQQSYAG
jgi:Uncharacterized protein conserved in bacteria (DUF2188)